MVVHYFILMLWVVGFSGAVQAATVYQCNEKGAISFQSKPCQGMGQTVADQLKAEQQAKEKRLADIQEKERLLQERLKQHVKPEFSFQNILRNLKYKFFHWWNTFKKSLSQSQPKEYE